MLSFLEATYMSLLANTVLAKHHRQQKCVASLSGGWKIKAVAVRLLPSKAMTENLSQTPLQLPGLCGM